MITLFKKIKNWYSSFYSPWNKLHRFLVNYEGEVGTTYGMVYFKYNDYYILINSYSVMFNLNIDQTRGYEDISYFLPKNIAFYWELSRRKRYAYEQKLAADVRAAKEPIYLQQLFGIK